MTVRWRPVVMTDPARPAGALALAGGSCWFDRVERLARGEPAAVLPADAAPAEALARLIAPRAPVAGVAFDRPRVMGILNLTPDSFSDGGEVGGDAAERGRAMAAAGADILDLGGESTRPGAREVPAEEEAARVLPAVAALRGVAPVSVDTRKAAVARAALDAGARIVNDVSALGFDPGMAAAARGAEGLCLMHAQGLPETMQVDPRYDDVLLDAYDHLEARVAQAEAAGIPRARVLVDPGLGFGKTLQHNVSLLRRVSLLHGLGCAVMVGASRKGMVGALTGVAEPRARLAGSVAAALFAAAQGVQVVRVHDVAATVEALRLQAALWAADGLEGGLGSPQAGGNG